MAKLTSRLLNSFPFSQHADAKSIQRGRNYQKEGRVRQIEIYDDDVAYCDVEGTNDIYMVEIRVDARTGELRFDCDCPYAVDHFCKHMVAAAIELSKYLETQEFSEDDEDIVFHLTDHDQVWQAPLDTMLCDLPVKSASGAAPQRYAAVLLLYEESYYYHQPYKFKPYIIRARDWHVLQGMPFNNPQAINDLLAQNQTWLQHAEEMYHQLNPSGCLNLAPEAFNLLQFLQQTTRFYSGNSTFIQYLALFARLDIPVFILEKSRKKMQNRVTILPDPVETEIVLYLQDGKLVMDFSVRNAPFDMMKADAQKLEIISEKPPWILKHHTLFNLRNANQMSILSSLPITIPEKDINFFRDHYLSKIAKVFPIRSDLVQLQDIHADPVPRLYLRDDKQNTMLAELRFGYEQFEVAASKTEETMAVEVIPDSWDLLHIHRQPEKEQAFYQLLTDPIYRLKRAGNSHPYGTLALRTRSHPFDFLMQSIPLLTQAGFEIYGEEKLKIGKINRNTPTLRVNITSGIDWFDLQTIIEYGDQQISLQAVRKALKRGENYIKLADGSIGQIPEKWLEKYKHLWNLAHETEDGFRISDFHLPLVDSLMEDGAAIQAPPDLPQRRQRLQKFEQIAQTPLPEGFVGELRPYQKHGYDWLHFLHEYKFGGILADDMGLGKTIQMLAFLQSLQERIKEKPASLLVVPKSLIANWQREAEKFTPGLRFLEYMGNFRNKDTAAFNEYDVILTTYGTMLRDISLLREYTFHLAILDESQAIKNPLAKSAKAARLLNAENHLVMTGTPVENNTFELWSQFAFINPGLLGGLDYFKKEFANPIESTGDEQTATTLRKLIYPFILRRTKEQVAPELPPRTERILYTDMDPAQKKLYAQTRERYRAELLGLIENEGMNDARFKILEGLLRLRQIAIHPALMDKNYKGHAPKFELLLETLETLQSENHKALIFSQFVETLHLVRRELDERNIKYVYLDGKTSKRQSHVDTFQNDPSIPFFLISLKAGGVGLNLTAADYVIHLDPWWNPAVEMQASDRAHRIGQEKPVFIYKIIARDTVEEKILQLQEKKRALVKNLISSETNFFKSLTKEDVQSLFT
jgi:non-specific serine/threonine protein kinase